VGFTLYPRNKELDPINTSWGPYCLALEEGPGLVIGMDRTIELGMFYYDEAPRNKDKAFAGSDGFYVLASDAKKMGELLLKKIHIHELRAKEMYEMSPEEYRYAKEHYGHRFPVNARILESWRELADFMIHCQGYTVR